MIILHTCTVKPNLYVIIVMEFTSPLIKLFHIPGFSVTAPWAFIWFLDGNENKVDISIVGTNGKFFPINAHGLLRRMGAVTEISGSHSTILFYYHLLVLLGCVVLVSTVMVTLMAGIQMGA